MEPFLALRYGNPSAAHALGRDAVRAVDEAREEIADVIGCTPAEVVFTSGGTEADVHAVTGGVPPRAGAVVCSAVEHPAVLQAVRAIDGHTAAVHPDGRIDLDALRLQLRGTGPGGAVSGGDASEGAGRPVELVSVMTANNELGTVNDLAAVAAVVSDVAPEASLHTDAVQAAPWLDLRDHAAPAALVSVSAHKFGGPKGVGALVVRAGTRIRPLMHGGGQELGLRSGTTNVAGVLGMAAALRSVASDRAATASRVSELRDRLALGLCAVPGVTRTVPDGTPLLPGTLHVLVDDVDSEPLLFMLDAAGILASASSACASGAAKASHVLDAIGVGSPPEGRVRGALRLSLGHDITEADVDRATVVIAAVVEQLRGAAHAGARS